MYRILITTLTFLVFSTATPLYALDDDGGSTGETTVNVRGDLDAARKGWARINKGALVIDVRSEEEFAAGHLEGALRIGYQDTDALAQAISGDPDRPVVLYCGSGRRAGIAKTALEERGYTNIYNASGLDALEATRP